MTDVPPTLSAATTQAGGRARQPRARSNIPGRQAGILPPVRPGEIVFRLFPDSKTLRAWGRKFGFTISDRGRIPRQVREHFDRWNAWSVYVVSVQVPGADTPSAYYKVMQGRYERRLTTDPDMVKRELGPELYPYLRQVENP